MVSTGKRWFLICLLFLLISGTPSFAQHVPVYFYNVTNWYAGGNDNEFSFEQKMLAHQFKDPYSSFATDWSAKTFHCPDGSDMYLLLDVYQVPAAYHDPDDTYNAHYADSWDYCATHSGSYPYSSSSIKYAACGRDVRVHESAGPNSCPVPRFDPEKNRGFPRCPCVLKGDPINPLTGNKVEEIELYQGSGGFPLRFAITYNGAYGNSSTLGPLELALGHRRVHSYMRSISVYKSGTAATAYVVRPDGKVLAFDRHGDAWAGDADASEVLAASYASDGSIAGWTLTDGAGGAEQYNGAGQLISLIQRGGLTQNLAYGTDGRLASVTDAQGRQLTFAYDTSGRISGVTVPGGEIYGFTYDASGNLSAITNPDTTQVQFLYNESGGSGNPDSVHNLTGVIDEANVRIDTTTYDTSDRATSATGPNGAGATSLAYTVDGYGVVSSTVVTDAMGATETWGAQYAVGVAMPTSIQQACTGCTTKSRQYGYDTNGFLTSGQDYLGAVTAYTRGAYGLETQRIESQGRTTQRTIQTDWNTSLRVPTESRTLDASGTLVAKSQWVYNARGQVLARCEIDPGKASSYTCASTGIPPAGVSRSTYVYCDAVDSTQCPQVGLLLTTTGARTDVSATTSYSYYLSTDESSCGTAGGACHHAGDLYQVTDAVGHVTTYVSYDKNGRVTRQRDANGILTDFIYHARGWLLTRTVRANTDGTPSSNDAISQIGYTPYGAVASVTDPDGVKVTYTYDAAHRLTDITDALGNRIHYTLDAAGNKTKEETFDSSGTLRRSLARSFNTLGQLTGIKDGLNRTVFDASFSDSYDANGYLVRSADALGIQRKQGYDALNRLVSTIDNYNGTDTATQNTQSVFAYDARDQLQGVSDPDGLNTTYDYDGLGNTTGVHSPDTGTSTYAYDAAGNRIQATDARGIVSHSTYDALNRITATTYPDSASNVSYYYDEPDSTTSCVGSYPIGRLTRIVETAVTTVYCYDARGNVVQKRQTQGTNVDTVSYTYTLADRLASTRTPDGTAIQYGRDGSGHINAVTVLPPGTTGAGAGNVVTNVSYLPFGPIASYTLGNGQTITRTYDANYAVTDVVSPALNLHFARDAMGNITALGNAPGANPAIETYSYDPLYRLTGLKDAQGQAIEAYTYNKTGDRLSKTSNGQATGTYGYQAGTHWLTSIGNSARTYDANGNTTGSTAGSDTFGYGYSDRNRMSVVQRNGQTVANYTYNAMGQRVAKVAATNQRFAYDEGSQLIGEYGAANRTYIWLDNLPIAIVDSNGTANTVSYVHADGLNTPRVVSDAAGSPMWQWEYRSNPFGEAAAASTGQNLNLRFPGQYFDPESGLAQNVYRDYEAASGRYIQSDPTGLKGGLGTFGYANQNPIQYIDPNGRTAIPMPMPAPIVAPWVAPVAAVGAAGALGYGAGTLINNVYGDAIGDAIWNATHPPATRPSDMSRLEERQFDRSCKDSEDPCASLKTATRQAIAQAKIKMSAMQNDKTLYTNAFSSPNASVTGTSTTWLGHENDLRGRLANIAAMISLGQKMGCDMSLEAALASTLFVPTAPVGM
jgi:RHS repeat-associated protein